MNYFWSRKFCEICEFCGRIKNSSYFTIAGINGTFKKVSLKRKTMCEIRELHLNLNLYTAGEFELHESIYGLSS